LLYVLLEYLFFIHWWRPIIYKESLILVLILLILVCKPTGLFSSWKRAI
jgi:branched-subunit amino acid ABC-type transport system permease component